MASIAAAMGDPVRINMLMSIHLESALTAGDLAKVGNVAPSTASEHLAKMQAAGLIVQQKLGRQRLYTLSGEDVCNLLDGVEAMALKQTDKGTNIPRLDRTLLHSRLCYHHLAGKVGCDVTDALFAENILTHDRKGPHLTDQGRNWAKGFEVDTDALEDSPRKVVRLCPDWTEDRPHLGGALGSALLDGFKRRDWLRFARGSSEVLITPKGFSGFRTELGIDLRAA